MTPTDRLLTSKELAAALGRSTRYVRYMRAKGFVMPGNTATLNEARGWLVRNPSPAPRGGKRLNASALPLTAQ